MRHLKLFAVVILVLTALTGITYYIIRNISLGHSKQSLKKFVNRVQNDLEYKNGIWDMTKYNADPETPHPHGSSGFSNPLYILATDGFVIERSNPIPRFLNSSDFKHLSLFLQPQSISPIEHETWRILAKPIIHNDKTVGIVVVSMFNPNNPDTVQTDAELLRNVELISSKLKFDDDKIDASGVDIRTIDYDIAFEIVDRFNTVILNNGRTPTYIDPSYVSDAMDYPEFRIIRNPITSERFLIHSQTIKNTTGSINGVIVAGQSIQPIDEILSDYLYFSMAINLFVTPLIGWSILRIVKKMATKKSESKDKETLHKLEFDSKLSRLTINERTIEIPFASNQYYLCKTLFSAPKKRFELDEVLERFGETESDNWRTAYDTVVAVNKKAGCKIIEYKDKTFMIDPLLQSFARLTK